MESLLTHYNLASQWCEDKKCYLISVAVFGSQNYGTVQSNSDLDTKAMIVPPIGAWLYRSSKKDFKDMLLFEDGGHCEITPLYSLFEQFSKGNINFLEWLVTDDIKINPIFSEWIAELHAHAEEIITHDLDTQHKVWIGYINQMIKRVTATLDGDYNYKALANAFRLIDTYDRYFNKHYSFKEAIFVPNLAKEIRAIKNKEKYVNDEVPEVLNDLNNRVQKMVDQYKPTNYYKDLTLFFEDMCIKAYNICAETKFLKP